MSFARDTMLIFRRQIKLSLRNPAWVIIGLIQPILYLAFFGPLLSRVAAGAVTGFPPGNSYSFFVPGLLIQLGLFGAAFVGFTIIVSYTVGLLTKSEDVLAPAINMVVVPLMLLSGIMLPMTLGPGWLQGIARATPFRYIIDAMRGAFAGHYLTTIMLEGILVALGLAVACLWIAGRAFVRENA
jgi:ABC-type multidrug transport system permease subunit